MLVLLGPTGSGKTEALSRLDPERYEIISCDSRQIYKGLEISTAAPEPALQSRLRHHLVSFLSPQEEFTAGRFVRQARAAIRTILMRGKTPIVTGGAGFYYRALKNGMFPVETSPELRRQIEAMSPLERLERLKEVDPQALISKGETAVSGRIHPHDSYRVFRALEISLASGRRWSCFWEDARRQVLSNEFSFRGFWLDLPQREHECLLQRRAKMMLAAGIVSEVGQIYEGYGLCPGLATLGCREALAVYLGKGVKAELTAALTQTHRRYAKKQRVWLRKERELKPVTPTVFKQHWQGLEALLSSMQST